MKSSKSKEALLALLPDMDFSNYSSDSVLHNSEHENEPFYFKEESAGKVDYVEMVFLSPKCYSIKLRAVSDDGLKEDQMIKCKGVPSVLKSKLPHEYFLDVLKTNKKIHLDYYAIRPKDYVVRTQKFSKIALSALDLKRYWVCFRHSLAFGNVLIPEIQQESHCRFCKQEEDENIFLDNQLDGDEQDDDELEEEPSIKKAKV